MDVPTIGAVIWYADPRAAIAWLEAAFGFETRMIVDDGSGGVIHSELRLGDGYVMVVGPPRGKAASPSAIDGRTTQSIHIQIAEGLDQRCEIARRLGAVIEREPEDQPYGDRVFTCHDLEGHPWSFGQTLKSLTIDEMSQATGHTISS